jgi:adenylylsulfate kinase-like enzyme
VLVINGTIGAGKTSVAGAVSTLLTERGSRYGYIDGDYLCQAQPHSSDDPYHQRLFFDNLAAVAPQYRARGCGIMVIARVVEDEADRNRYRRALATSGTPAEVTIVRITASEDTRLARITAREPEGHWQEWASVRTVELEQALDDLGLDDAVVTNEGRSPRETAEELLDSIGW